MTSRLSSLLVRDGLVTVKRMERVFQRQVIYGGALDSVLLEMNLLTEERLTQYLALASGLPPATREEVDQLEPAAVARMPHALAEKHKAVPLGLDADAMRILVYEPVDVTNLEDLADALDLALRPLVVPEYRWHIAMARAYGVQAPTRFLTLARQVAPLTAPVGRSPSVIVAADNPAVAPGPIAAEPIAAEPIAVPVAPAPVTIIEAKVEAKAEPRVEAKVEADAAAPGGHAPARSRTREFSTPALSAELERQDLMRRDAERRYGTATETMEVPQVVIELSTVDDIDDSAGDERDGPDEQGVKVVEDEGQWPGRRTLPGIAAANPVDPAPVHPRAVPIVSIPVSYSDPRLSPAEARAAMLDAKRKDDVFTALLQGVHSFTRWAGFLTLQSGAAVGRLAVADAGIDTAEIRKVALPLDVPSPFLTAVTSRKPYVGPLVTGHANVDTMLRRMGGMVPPVGLIAPVVLRDRAVGLVVAHRMEQSLSHSEIGRVVPLLEVAAQALVALIVRGKESGRAEQDASPAPTASATDLTRPLVHAPPADAVAAPSPRRRTTRNTEHPVDRLVDSVESADDTVSDNAIVQAIERADEVLPIVADRFPGNLRIDRYAVSGRVLRAAHYGKLLELLVRIGAGATPLVIQKMSDPNRDIRFYAVVCALELRPRSALPALVERLFDADYGIRELAIEALAGYPARDLEVGLLRARHAIHSEDFDRVVAATSAIAALGDAASIPDLIDVVGAAEKRGEHARRALVQIVRQDFGTSERKWRRWWDDNRRRHRIEWLIDALGHKEATLRHGAGYDLRRMTGEYFGYHHDLPKRERDAAIVRWQQWWHETGRKRFAREDAPTSSPT